MFSRVLLCVLRRTGIVLILLFTTLESLGQGPPTSAPTTAPTSRPTESPKPPTISEITRDLHPPSVETILSWLEPIPDVSIALARLAEAKPTDAEEKPPTSQPTAAEQERMAELQGELAARREHADYASASKAAGELAGWCSQVFGPQNWQTLDAQSLCETLGNLAVLPVAVQQEFAEVEQLQPRIEGLYAQNRFEEVQRLVLRRLGFLRSIGLGNHPAAAEDWLTMGTLLRATSSFRLADLCYREGIRIYRDRLSIEHPDVATGLQGLAWLRYEQGDQVIAERLFCATLTLRRRVFGEENDAVVMSLSNLATIEQQKGAYTIAEQLLKRARDIQAALPASDPLKKVQPIYALAGLLKAKGDYAEASRLYEQVLNAIQNAGGHHQAEAAACLNNLGVLAMMQGDYPSASKLLRQALRSYLAAYGEAHADVMACQNNLTAVFLAMGDLRSAEAYARDAVRTAQELFGDQSLAYADSGTSLAMVLHRMGDRPAAESLYRRALDIRRRICGGNHALVAQSENNLATLLRQTDRFDEAEQHYTSALEIRRQVFGPRHPETAEALHNLANLLLSRGNPEEAESHFREAIDILQQVPGGRFPSITESWHGLAMIGIEKGEYTQAEDLLRQAIALEQKHGFSASYHHQVTLANLLRTRLGRPSEALLLYAEAIQVIERLRLQVGGDELDRARYSSQLARWEAFGGMARAQLAAIGKNSEHGVRKAFDYLERGRGRALLDLLDRSGQNMFETAAARADQSEATAREIATTRLAAVQAKAREVAAERQIETTEQDDTRDEPEKAERLLQLQKERDAARDAERVALRRLYDLARDGLRSQGLKPMVALEVAAGLLKPGELLLLYDIGEADALLLVLQSGGGASAFWLSWPDGNMVTQSSLAERVNRIMARIRSNTPQSTDLQASEADNLAELASALLPSALQPKLRVASCLFLVPDGPLDELPFEVLPLSATPAAQSLRDGPPIVYGPSATVLATLRAKGRQRDVERVAVGQTTLLAVGDPVFDRTFKKSSPSIPERGILVTDVAAGSSAARSGIGSGDVILRYDGQEVNDTEALKHAIQRRPAPGPTTAPSEPSPGDLVPVQVWRGDGNQEFRVAVGPLGVTASTRPMPEALQAYREPKRSDADRHASVSYRRTRDGFGGLDSLPGTRREANAIAQVIRASGASQDSCRILLGEEATLGNLEARSDHPRFLHLATHGLAGGWRPEENALAFTVPLDPTPTDDGFLRLSDLLYQWGGRLDRTELVVLSACRTAAGPRAAGEGLMALTWGFLFAGADSVVASLWEADDQATALLMQRFYQNLLGLFAESRAGYVPKTPMPKCVALLEAKRWLSTSSPQENRRQLESMGFEVDGRQQPRIPKSDVLPSKAPQLLENPTNFSDPYYWAGFVLIGDPD